MNHTRWHRGARLMVLGRPPATPMRTTRDRWRSLADLDTGRLRWVDLGATYRGDAVPRRQGSVSAVLRGDWGGPSEDCRTWPPISSALSWSPIRLATSTSPPLTIVSIGGFKGSAQFLGVL